ncbi:hypothetical protein Stsp02_21340 [Streptomyces sp. NBRC 14336]|nr:hypothetical protein Stsp02_21340 [Streptomyces sp. NBRC 14336]
MIETLGRCAHLRERCRANGASVWAAQGTSVPATGGGDGVARRGMNGAFGWERAGLTVCRGASPSGRRVDGETGARDGPVGEMGGRDGPVMETGWWGLALVGARVGGGLGLVVETGWWWGQGPVAETCR